jgi:hypothetical protein
VRSRSLTTLANKPGIAAVWPARVDTALRDSLLELADEYMARAAALQGAGTEFETPTRTIRAPI